MSKFLYTLLLLLSSLNATQLQFEMGQTASLSISQDYSVKMTSDALEELMTTHAIMNISMQITNNQPLEVDLTINDLLYMQSGNVGYMHEFIDEHLSSYCHVPFHFILNNEHDIEETTGRLADIYSRENPLIIGFSPMTLKMILAQMFQLNEQTLIEGQSYSIDSTLILGADQHSCSCTITDIAQNKASGTYLGQIGDVTTGYIYLDGDVTWDLCNSMLQTRHCNIAGDTTDLEKQRRTTFSLTQTWQYIASNSKTKKSRSRHSHPS